MQPNSQTNVNICKQPINISFIMLENVKEEKGVRTDTTFLALIDYRLLIFNN